MPKLPSVLLASAAVVLGVIAWRAEERNYSPLSSEAIAAEQQVPTIIVDAPAPGFRLIDFEVEGMCCLGCSGKLHAALSAVPEVVAAAVDFDRARASAVVPEDFEADRLLTVLSRDKYSARVLRPAN